ncbi:MAG: hypothetical protein KBS62_03100 [Oscillospiraceae bacterium]|nr:hypothetical protein [Candidatus Ruminococcus equi]
MTTQARNRKTIYYAVCNGSSEIVDADGNKTSRYELQYSEQVKAKMSISPDNGIISSNGYGLADEYKRTMTTADMNCPITDNTKLWIGIEPTEKHNYIVESVSKGLNLIVYKLKKV